MSATPTAASGMRPRGRMIISAGYKIAGPRSRTLARHPDIETAVRRRPDASCGRIAVACGSLPGAAGPQHWRLRQVRAVPLQLPARVFLLDACRAPRRGSRMFRLRADVNPARTAAYSVPTDVSLALESDSAERLRSELIDVSAQHPPGPSSSPSTAPTAASPPVPYPGRPDPPPRRGRPGHTLRALVGVPVETPPAAPAVAHGVGRGRVRPVAGRDSSYDGDRRVYAAAPPEDDGWVPACSPSRSRSGRNVTCCAHAWPVSASTPPPRACGSLRPASTKSPVTVGPLHLERTWSCSAMSTGFAATAEAVARWSTSPDRQGARGVFDRDARVLHYWEVRADTPEEEANRDFCGPGLPAPFPYADPGCRPRCCPRTRRAPLGGRLPGAAPSAADPGGGLRRRTRTFRNPDRCVLSHNGDR